MKFLKIDGFPSCHGGITSLHRPRTDTKTAFVLQTTYNVLVNQSHKISSKTFTPQQGE